MAVTVIKEDFYILWFILFLIVVLFIYNNYSGLANVSSNPAIAQQAATTGGVPIDINAQNYVDSLEDVDIDADLLATGRSYNINTRSGNKNRNQQLRPDPVVTQIDTGYFNNSTIIPDYSQRDLFTG